MSGFVELVRAMAWQGAEIFNGFGAPLGEVWMGDGNYRTGWDFETPRKWWFWRYEPIEDEI